MNSTQYLPDEIKKTFGFKLAVYILPGIMFALVTVLVIVPAPKTENGVLEGKIIGMVESGTLVAEPLLANTTSTEIMADKLGNYHADLLPGRYRLFMKTAALFSPQLPREITITKQGVTVLDITIEKRG